MSAPVLLSEVGSLPETTKVALWVHWERTGAVSDADLLLLQHLNALGYSVVAVGNRDDGEDDAFTRRLAEVADVVLQRRNLGYDFAGFRDGLLWLRGRLAPGTTLLMVNNSMYGPFGSLEPLLQEANPQQGDVWALTGSLEIEPHVQSYFMVLHPRALMNEGFWSHWAGVRPPKEKMRVVHECEVPLALKLHNQGLRVRALRPHHDLARRALERLVLIEDHRDDPAYTKVVRALRRGAPLNPTHHLWRWVLDSGVPLVKKDLLRVNPPGLPDVADWMTLVGGDERVRAAVGADLAGLHGGGAASSSR